MSKEIILGVSGSIAIYRACEIARELTKAGIRVQVAMTRCAANWVAPQIFTAITELPVMTDASEAGMAHIEIRKKKSLYLIAPATADLIARAAIGRADDLVASTLLSYDGPRWIAPAMNPFMFSHPATQNNLKTLQKYGYKLLDTENGEAICGDIGKGKMMATSKVVALVKEFLT